MLQKKTVKNAILDLFAERGTCLSCAQIVKQLEKEEILFEYQNSNKAARSAAINHLLHKLVKKGTLQYAIARGDKGEYIYEIADRLTTKPNEEEDE